MLAVTKLAVHLDLNGPIEERVERARRAEAAGADAVYVIEGQRDPFVPLAAIAAATSRIGIGTYVANAYARTPQAAATAALAVDELSNGRLVFGIGAGNRHINDWFLGDPMAKPVTKLHDYLAVLRAFLQGERGSEAHVGGPVHRMETRFVQPGERRIPIVVAAAAPRMTELAASASDGVALGILIGVEHVNEVVRPRAIAACERAGRDPAALRWPMAALVSVDDDEQLARLRARRAIVGLFHPVPHPYYDYLLREQGFAAVADAASELAPQKRWGEAVEAIGDELLDRLTFSGTPDQVAERFAAYDGVVDEIVCLDVGLGGRAPADPDALLRAIRIAKAR